MVYHSPPLPTQPFSEETAQKHDLWIWIWEVNIPETMAKEQD